jgi:hypothetical protein
MDTIRTADNKIATSGDRVFDYYDGHWGTIGQIISADGWFDHHREDGGRGYLDGNRVCAVIPPGNPFYEKYGFGNPKV